LPRPLNRIALASDRRRLLDEHRVARRASAELGIGVAVLFKSLAGGNRDDKTVALLDRPDRVSEIDPEDRSLRGARQREAKSRADVGVKILPAKSLPLGLRLADVDERDAADIDEVQNLGGDKEAVFQIHQQAFVAGKSVDLKAAHTGIPSQLQRIVRIPILQVSRFHVNDSRERKLRQPVAVEIEISKIKGVEHPAAGLIVGIQVVASGGSVRSQPEPGPVASEAENVLGGEGRGVPAGAQKAVGVSARQGPLMAEVDVLDALG